MRRSLRKVSTRRRSTRGRGSTHGELSDAMFNQVYARSTAKYVDLTDSLSETPKASRAVALNR